MSRNSPFLALGALVGPLAPFRAAALPSASRAPGPLGGPAALPSAPRRPLLRARPGPWWPRRRSSAPSRGAGGPGGPPPRTPLQAALDAAFELGFSAAYAFSPTAARLVQKPARAVVRALLNPAGGRRRRGDGAGAAVEPLARRRGARAAVGAGDGEARPDRGCAFIDEAVDAASSGTARRRWCSSAAGDTARCTPAAAPVLRGDLLNVVEAAEMSAGYCAARGVAGAGARRRPQRGGGRRARAARGRRRRLRLRGAHARRERGRALLPRRRRRRSSSPSAPRWSTASTARRSSSPTTSPVRPRPRAPRRRRVLATWLELRRRHARGGAIQFVDAASKAANAIRYWAAFTAPRTVVQQMNAT